MAAIEDLPRDVATRVLRHLDGSSLAAASCATAHLRSLSNHPSLWFSLCTSTWPSLRHCRVQPFVSAAAKSFFSDAFSFPDGGAAVSTAPPPPTIISAVDIFHKEKLLFSTVIETDTNNSWFMSSPFRIDFVAATPPPVSADELTLSWIIIDPLRRRAVNLSSRRAAAIRRRRYVASTQLIFAVVLAGGMAAATVAVVFEEGTAAPRAEISLCVEDCNGVCLSGEKSMEIIAAVVGGGRKGSLGGAPANAAAYEEFVARRRAGKEKMAAMERRHDLLCVFFGFFFFLVVVLLFFFVR